MWDKNFVQRVDVFEVKIFTPTLFYQPQKHESTFFANTPSASFRKLQTQDSAYPLLIIYFWGKLAKEDLTACEAFGVSAIVEALTWYCILLGFSVESLTLAIESSISH